MIRQYLSNTNQNVIVFILQKKKIEGLGATVSSMIPLRIGMDRCVSRQLYHNVRTTACKVCTS